MTTETQALTDVEIGAILASPGDMRWVIATKKERYVLFARAIEQAVLQSPEIQALRKDAERYRHLRDEAELSPHDIFNAWWLSDHGNPQTLDAAIDAAMEQKP